MKSKDQNNLAKFYHNSPFIFKTNQQRRQKSHKKSQQNQWRKYHLQEKSNRNENPYHLKVVDEDISLINGYQDFQDQNPRKYSKSKVFQKKSVNEQQGQMILIPKSKLMGLQIEIKLLKEAIRDQKRNFEYQISMLKNSVSTIEREKRLIQKQTAYLEDLKRTNSLDIKNIYYSKMNNQICNLPQGHVQNIVGEEYLTKNLKIIRKDPKQSKLSRKDIYSYEKKQFIDRHNNFF